MPFSFETLWNTILGWTHQYGYHAVVPTLVGDPAGVPWAWIFLMLIAEEARLRVPLILVYGCAVLAANDHLLFWLGRWGGRPLVSRLTRRWPRFESSIKNAEEALCGKGIWVLTVGRYLPIAGRWVPLAGGLADVPYARFAFYDTLGVVLTVLGFGALAHFIGKNAVQQPWFPQAVLGAYIASTLLTALFTGWQVWRVKKRHAEKQEPARES